MGGSHGISYNQDDAIAHGLLVMWWSDQAIDLTILPAFPAPGSSATKIYRKVRARSGKLPAALSIESTKHK
jgi:hypothetical protein